MMTHTPAPDEQWRSSVSTVLCVMMSPQWTGAALAAAGNTSAKREPISATMNNGTGRHGGFI
jgi:hypothetical protein